MDAFGPIPSLCPVCLLVLPCCGAAGRSSPDATTTIVLDFPASTIVGTKASIISRPSSLQYSVTAAQCGLSVFFVLVGMLKHLEGLAPAVYPVSAKVAVNDRKRSPGSGALLSSPGDPSSHQS